MFKGWISRAGSAASLASTPGGPTGFKSATMPGNAAGRKHHEDPDPPDLDPHKDTEPDQRSKNYQINAFLSKCKGTTLRSLKNLIDNFV